MDYLGRRLDFYETDEMMYARQALVEAMRLHDEHVRAITEDYQIQAEAVVDAQEDDELRNVRRVAANIAMALIRIDGGRVDDGLDDLDIVLDDIDGMMRSGYGYMGSVSAAIEDKIAELSS
jgi:hypothetical protein